MPPQTQKEDAEGSLLKDEIIQIPQRNIQELSVSLGVTMGRRLRAHQYRSQEKEDSQKAIRQFHPKSQL